MMRDTFGRDAVLLLLFFGMLAIALAIALSWSRVAERTAYARGYAAAVDSVRSADTTRTLARAQWTVPFRPDSLSFMPRYLSLSIRYDGAVVVREYAVPCSVEVPR